MLLSMTGQGDGIHQSVNTTVSAEIRSVNSRYFKVNVRATEGLGGIESRVEALLRERIRRGAVHVDVRLDGLSAQEFRINAAVLSSYREQLGGLTDDSASIDALLQLPGVVEQRAVAKMDAEALWEIVKPAVQQAVASLDKMRIEEGKAMELDLVKNCESIREVLTSIEAVVPRVAAAYGDRLAERLNRLLEKHELNVQPADLVREVGLFAERCDISEELVRMSSHIDQFLGVIDQEEGNGRKLDFLTQEMFRETNTIGSKANDADISRDVGEIKALIERMREMIQNVE